MSLTYSTWLAAVANLAGTATTNPYFLIEVPNAIDYAEQRIYRDLDLLSTITTDATQTTVSNNRNVAIPSAFFVVNDVNIITPAGQAPDSGKRNPLVKVSEAYLDLAWPSAAGATLPTLYSLRNQTQMILGPWPDQGYAVEYVGTQRPAPLSASNTTTFLTTTLPDLFLIASMIHIAAYQKNFGAQADDPRSAVSWEMQYKLDMANANAEELRKRYRGTVVLPPPGITPPAPPAPPAA
jgi:hypothetical protein